ncbi:hypothetical protein HDV05_000730 [Chytridiales sp. JEL 0842]|nr:hypothetical protein HDV05_000730 [Chytridiales sp. JEL 0842]
MNTTEINLHRKRDTADWPKEVLNSKRICVSGKNTTWMRYVLTNTFVRKAANGEKVGPLITATLMNGFRSKSKTSMQTFEELLASDFMKNAAPDADTSSQLLKWYDRIKPEADEFFEETKKRKADEKKQRVAVKKAKVDDAVANIRQLVMEKIDAKHVDFFFPASKLFEEVVGHIKKAPSKATGRECKKIAEEFIRLLLPIQGEAPHYEKLKSSTLPPMYLAKVLEPLVEIGFWHSSISVLLMQNIAA